MKWSNGMLRRLFAVLLIAPVLLTVQVTGAMAGDVKGAEAFVQSLGDEAIEAIKQAKSSGQAPKTAFRVILGRSFDIPTIGRFILGKNWNLATPEQQQQYLQLFEELVVATYARRFRDYSGETFSVTGARETSSGNYAIVNSAIKPAGGPPVLVDWRVKIVGDYRILDVMVEGVSLSVAQRDEFNSIIERSGGRIDPLLDSLRQKIAQL